MGSSRTVLVLEDTSRKKFCGLGLVLEAPFAAKYYIFFLTLHTALPSFPLTVCRRNKVKHQST